MVENRQLDFLKRKNAGAKLLPELKAILGSTLGIAPEDVQMLALEASDEIRQQALNCFPPRDRLEHDPQGYPFVRKQFTNPSKSISILPNAEANIFLILPEADRVGVLQLPASVVNAKWQQLLALKVDGFVLVDSTFSNQLVAQMDGNRSAGNQCVDVAAWGTSWSKTISELAG